MSSSAGAVTKFSQFSIYRKDPWGKNLLKQSLGSQNKQRGILNWLILLMQRLVPPSLHTKVVIFSFSTISISAFFLELGFGIVNWNKRN